MTTSPHLPLCANSAALWELLSHPSLSSFKLGVRCWKRGSLWIWWQITEQSRAHQISADHSIIPGTAPTHPFRLISATFCNFFFLKTRESNERDWAGNDCSPTLEMRDLSGDTLTVAVSSRVVCSGKSWLTSEQWKLIQYSCRAAAMRGVSQVEDSAIPNVLICTPILTLMTLEASRVKASYSMQWRKKRYSALTFLSLYSLI